MSNEKEKVEITGGQIDPSVLDVMKQEDVLKSIEDPKLANRLILNCFCELLEQVNGLKKDMDEFMELVTINSSDKLESFFKNVNANMKEEENKAKLRLKATESHKKKTKNVKKDKNVVQ